MADLYDDPADNGVWDPYDGVWCDDCDMVHFCCCEDG